MSIIRDGTQSADLDIPVASPTLNLDFANSQELDPRITFTRGSIGTFVNKNGLIEIAPANIPRFDYDPISGECRGLLVEEQRTNLVTNSTSANFNGTIRLSIITDGTLAPDGSPANVYIPNSDYGIHSFLSLATINLNTIGIATGATYDVTFSSWVKDYNNSNLSVYFVNVAFLSGTPNTNLTYQLRIANPKSASWTGGTVQTGWARNYEKVVPYQNGWYRFIQSSRYTRQSNQDTLAFSFQIFNNRNTQFYNGDETSGIYVWGPQVEAGAFETSYIPTSGSQVTRSAEIAEMTGTNFSSWYNQTEGTFFFDGTLPFITTDTKTRVPYGVSNGLNFPNSIYISKGSTNLTLNFVVINNNVSQQSGTTGGNMTSSNFKIASAVAPRNIYTSLYGGIINPSRPFATIPTVDRLSLGREPWNASPLNPIIGCIRKFAYYPKALSPSQLQYLTQ